MLKNFDLDKILDEGYGDAGFNDPVNVDEISKADADTRKKEAGTTADTAAKERRPVHGASAPPPEGVDQKDLELKLALDGVARQNGFNSVEEYSKHLEEQKAKDKSGKQSISGPSMPEEEPQLAPGIKKSPAYMPPGAYPGDRTKIGNACEAPTSPPALSVPRKSKIPTTTTATTTTTAAGKFDPDLHKHEISFVKQSDQYGSRPSEGSRITFRVEEGGRSQEAEVGGLEIPWALEVASKKMKVGDIADVVGRGEYAHAEGDKKYFKDSERKWRLELMAVSGRGNDKFQLNAEERIERANALRLRGNEMFKQNRLLRALELYERGSSLMDVLEAEDLGMPGGKKDKVAEERNAKIWKCQQPLLLNWSLILMRLGRWQEAERKCTEVLMDIEKECVKALFRRGQCNVQLGNHEQARTDLMRAAELDTSIKADVEREMKLVEAMQREVDRVEKPEAQRIVGQFLKEADQRSSKEPVKKKESEREAALGPHPMLGALKAQEAAAGDAIDNDTWCRQREAIYNHFLPKGPPVDD
mmetsp:Transcript_45367/g.97260  ORF Transcript_45367/g.97260 Transcript_45367/m.97260 type:complete len:530 (+) Transcript_45367:136-1725(+)